MYCIHSTQLTEINFWKLRTAFLFVWGFFVHRGKCWAVTAATEIDGISSEHTQHYENQQLDLWCPNGIFKFLFLIYKMRIKMLWEKYSTCKTFRVLKSIIQKPRGNSTIHYRISAHLIHPRHWSWGKQSKTKQYPVAPLHSTLTCLHLGIVWVWISYTEGPSLLVFYFSSLNRIFYLSKITEPLMLGLFNCALESNTEQNDFSKKETATNKLILIKF